MPHGVSTLDNKPIIITFLAMEKVILLCTYKTSPRCFGSVADEFFLEKMTGDVAYFKYYAD